MVLKDQGAQAVTAGGGETTLFDDSASGLTDHSCVVFINNASMATGDTLIIKVYMKDEQGASMQLLYSWTVSGAQTEALNVPPIYTSEYKVTLTLTGTNRTFNWVRFHH
jgi:hypothetical protein